jgi:phenylalanyl-tRNA synthetase beta chain
MKFSENWLREWVNPPADRTSLLHRLTMAGLEVESLQILGENLTGVVVGEIVSAEKHPNADKLQVCKVLIGTTEFLQIVCGAPNARVGLKAPLATMGAILPNGLTIKAAALRGIDSQGMLCSAKELLLGEESNGLFELPNDAIVGQALADYMGFPDAIIEIKLTANRPDCLGLRGLAQDVAALYGVPLQESGIAAVAVQIQTVREVRLQAAADCPRYLGRVIEDIDMHAPTPLWMSERLRRSGLRSLNAVVDVTNYVMLELGQPMHAFDNSTLQGAIIVRRAQDGEILKLLAGNEAKLDEGFLLIADEHKALAIAGIMGGYDSRVSNSTQSIFLESAHFAPSVIMGRARKLGMHTDASHRFERGVDPELPRLAIERATALLLAIAGGKPGPVVEAVLAEHLPKRSPVLLRRARLARVLGMHVEDAEVGAILRGLDMQVETLADGWRATPPSRRFDIEREEDLIEEIARVHGYEKVPVNLPSGQLRLGLAPEVQLVPQRARERLASLGYLEAINYSFVAAVWLERWALSAGAVVLANPLSVDLAVMRTSLLPGLVASLQHNRRRQQERVRLFELGRVYCVGEVGSQESLRLAAVACGSSIPESWAGTSRSIDFHDLKADLQSVLALSLDDTAIEWRAVNLPYLHPGRSAELWLGGKSIGVIGNLHPRLSKALDLDTEVYVFEIDYALFAEGILPLAQALPRYPSIRRDIAMIVPEDATYAQVQDCVQKALGDVLKRCFLFDLYSGPNIGVGVKSLGLGLILQDATRTLVDQDADHCVAQAVRALEQQFSAKLRG